MMLTGTASWSGAEAESAGWSERVADGLAPPRVVALWDRGAVARVAFPDGAGRVVQRDTGDRAGLVIRLGTGVGRVSRVARQKHVGREYRAHGVLLPIL